MTQNPSPSEFGRALRAWRTDRHVSQRALEERLGKSRGYVTRLEDGSISPPDREACARLAHALELTPAEVWLVAARQRMADLDPDVLAFHDDEVRRASEYEVDNNGKIILSALDAVEEMEAAPSLTNQIATILAPLCVSDPEEGPEPDDRRLAEALVRIVKALAPVDSFTRAQVATAFAAVADAWLGAKNSPSVFGG